ncbi:APC family permease [Williamsia sp. CHRR-6]|nr:APC family permease [Williamsia sp. CHRR-6]
MASVAYGPEAIVLVLVAAGSRGIGFTIPVTLTIVVLLAVLIASYRQLIAAFPDGGGAYAVAKARLGDRAALVAAASLVIDYVLNVAVSIAAGTAALVSAFPGAAPHTVWIALGILAVVTGVNLHGIVTGARLFIVPTVIFVVCILGVIVSGLLGSRHELPPAEVSAPAVSTVGALLLLKAFSAGCSALTGVEAIANATPQFRRNRVRRAQRAEVALGVTLGLLMLGIAALIEKFDIRPRDGVTILSQVTEESVGRGIVYYTVQFATVVLLALAANTSFGGLPQLMTVVAGDDYLPHRLRRVTRRGVYRDGVLLLAVTSGVLLVLADGRTNVLVPLFAIGVFVGFTIAQAGLVRHWWLTRGAGWRIRLSINAFGAICTATATVVTFSMKFTEGSPLVVVIGVILVAAMSQIRRIYRTAARAERVTGAEAGAIGSRPHLSMSGRGVVVVPVGEASSVCAEALTRARGFGRMMVAVHVFGPTQDRDAYRIRWRERFPLVELVELDGVIDGDFVDPLVAWVAIRAHTDDILVVLADDDGDPLLKAMSAARGGDLERALGVHTPALVARVHCVPSAPRRFRRRVVEDMAGANG